MNEQNTHTKDPNERLITVIMPFVQPMGYEIVHVEVQNQRQKILRLFIDFLEQPVKSARNIGIEDCVKVTRALSDPLEKLPEVESIFHGAYELEVSSPGVDRPLRTSRDFERFQDCQIRVNVYRPLSANEIENEAYSLRNPKQKTFLGRIVGVSPAGETIRIEIPADGSSAGKSKRKGSRKTTEKMKNKGAAIATSKTETVTIPLSLISKANLEPCFEFDGTVTEIQAD